MTETLPSRSRLLTTAVRLCALVAMVVGVVTLIGWHAHVPLLLQLSPGLVPVRYNAALCYVLGGTGLWLVASGRARLARLFGAAGLAIAALTLIEYLVGRNLGIDELLMDVWMPTGSPYPGRMSINASASLTLVFAGLLFATRQSRSQASLLLVSAAGSVAVALSVIALVGYASDLPTAYSWTGLAAGAIAPASAVAIILLAGGLVALAWDRSLETERELPRWLPSTVAIAVIAGGVVLSQALAARDYDSLKVAVETALQGMTAHVRSEVDDCVRAIERVARRVGEGERPGDAMWTVDERQLRTDYPGLLDLARVGPAGVAALEGRIDESDSILNDDVRSLIGETVARSLQAPRLSRIVRTAGRAIFVVAAPVRASSPEAGVIVGIFDARKATGTALSERSTIGYDTDIADQDHVVFWSSHAIVGAPVFAARLPLFGATWIVRAWPSDVLLSRWGGHVPAITFVSSVVLALLLAAVLALFQSSVRLHHRAEHSRQALAQEVAERRRTEESLRRSESLLRLVLETLPVGVWIADATGRIVTVNQAGMHVWGGARYSENIAGYAEYKGWHVDDGRPVAADEWPLARAVLGETVPLLVADIETFDLARKTVSCSGVPIRHPDGSLAGGLVVVQDITERVKAERALAERTADLERSNGELEQFAYVASHDLQEPLRMVASYVQLLARRYRGKLDEDADEFIRFAVDGARRMQALLNDLLAYSRVGTRGKPFERVDMNEALRAAQENLQVAVVETGATVTTDKLPAVDGDETQIVQLLQNLLANAMKFRSEQPPRIHVGVTRHLGQTCFQVADNGVGIHPDYHDRIFQIFQRLHGQRYPGTGVGLAIAKKIVLRHGGQIWVKSAEQQGATFFFTLPGVSSPSGAGGQAATTGATV